MHNNASHLWSADLLRVTAIGLVAWYHIWQQSWLSPSFSVGNIYINLQQVVRNGYLMVDVLLVLSGFLLALPYCAQDNILTARDFYRRRFFRIYPSYLLIIVFSLLFQVLPQHLYTNTNECLFDILTHLTFTHNLFYRTYLATPLTGVLWTLAVEVQFYILFPLIVHFYRIHPWRTCIAMCAAAWLYRGVLYFRTDTTFYVNQLPAMLDVFAAGMAAAKIYCCIRTKQLSRPMYILILFIAVITFLLMLQILYWQTLGDQDTVHRGQLLLRFPLALCAAAFLVSSSLIPIHASSAIISKVLCFLAGITYNFYLWHQFIALRLKDLHWPAYVSELPNQAGEQPWQSQYTFLCFTATTVVSILLTYTIEKPFTKFGHKKLPPS